MWRWNFCHFLNFGCFFARYFGGISHTSWPGRVWCNAVVATDRKKLSMVWSVSPLCVWWCHRCRPLVNGWIVMCPLCDVVSPLDCCNWTTVPQSLSSHWCHQVFSTDRPNFSLSAAKCMKKMVKFFQLKLIFEDFNWRMYCDFIVYLRR